LGGLPWPATHTFGRIVGVLIPLPGFECFVFRRLPALYVDVQADLLCPSVISSIASSRRYQRVPANSV